MAILKDLLVQGSSRFINKAYFNDIQVSGTATLASLSTTGDITAGGNLYSTTGYLYLKNLLALDGHDNWLRINADSTFTSGVYFGSSKARLDANFQIGNGGSNINVVYSSTPANGSLAVHVPTTFDGSSTTVQNLIVPNFAQIKTLDANNVNVSNLLRASRYDLQTVSQLGGAFYVSPTLKFPSPTTTQLVVANNNGTLSLTITDTSITTTELSGIVWTQGSAVKVSGTINGVTTGTMDGTVTTINTTSHVLTLSVSGENSSNVVAGTYTTSQFSDLCVMVYQRRSNGTSMLTKSASGAIANFSDGADGVLVKSLTVDIEPVQSGSGDPSPDNIRPISGWDAVNVYRTGANIWGGQRVVEGIQHSLSTTVTLDESAGTISFANSASAYTDNNFVFNTKFKENTRYTFIIAYEKSTGTGSNMRVYYTDGSYDGIPAVSQTSTKTTVVFVTDASKTVESLRKFNSSGTTKLYYNECCVLEGVHTADDFTPYVGTVYDVTLPQTVYSGMLDATSGVLTVTHKMVTLNGTESWATGGANQGFYTAVHDFIKVTNYTTKLLSDRLKTYANNGNNDYKSSANGITGYYDSTARYPNQNWIYAKGGEATTTTEFKAWLGQNPVTVVYELAEPFSVQLTPTEVRTLQTNNIWADTGDVTVVYQSSTPDTNDYNVGILMNCYDTANSSSTMRIYGGQSVLPNVMLGNLTNANLGVVNGLEPQGWGLFAQNAFLHGHIIAERGKIGGFTLSEKSLYTVNNYPSLTNFYLMPAGVQEGTYAIGGSSTARNDWVMTAGDAFGVTRDGTVYANQAVISGNITATGGKIGEINIGTSSIYSGSKNAYNSNNSGFYLGSDGKFGLGANNGQYLRWDGSNLQMNVNSLSIGGSSVATQSYVDTQEIVIIGTQTAITNAWTGTTDKITSLVNGQRIIYFLPYASASNVTLNITLSNGSTTGAINCYYGSTTRLGTQYGSGNFIRLIYRENAVFHTGTDGATTNTLTGWWADANYNTNDNTYDRTRYYVNIKAATAIVAKNIIVGTSAGYRHLKDPNDNSFDVSYPILYANAAITTAGGTGNNNYIAIPFAVATTQSMTLTAYKAVYIKGTLSGSTFTPINTTPLTQTVPSQRDGYYYMYLGTAYSTTQIYLEQDHPIYVYDYNAFQRLDKIARNYLYYDPNNGLVISQTGVVSTGYNTQITDSGMNIRNGSTPLARYGSSIILGELASGKTHVEIDTNSFDVCSGANTGANSTKLATFGAESVIGDMSTRGVSITDKGFKFNNDGMPAFYVGVDYREGLAMFLSDNYSVSSSSTTTTINDKVYYLICSVANDRTIVQVGDNLHLTSDEDDEVLSAADSWNYNDWVVNSNKLYISKTEIDELGDSDSVNYIYSKDANSVADPYCVIGKSVYSTQNPAGIMSLSQGYGCTASGAYSTSVGWSNTSSGMASVSCGNQSKAQADYSFAGGFMSTVSGKYSFAYGYKVTASGGTSFACGYEATASASFSIAMGQQSRAISYNSTAIGFSNYASGYNSTAMGCNSTASGEYSITLGDGSTASGISSIAMGSNTVAARRSQLTIGTYNIADTEPTTPIHPANQIGYGHYAFIIGNGKNNDNRSNAFTVDWTGNVEASGQVYQDIQHWSSTSFSNASGAIEAHKCGNIVWVHGYHSLNAGATYGTVIMTLQWKPVAAASISTQNDAVGYNYSGYFDIKTNGNITVGTSWSGNTRYSFCYLTNDT